MRTIEKIILSVIIILMLVGGVLFIDYARDNSGYQPTSAYQLQTKYFIKNPCYNSSGEVPLIQVSESEYYTHSNCGCNNAT